MRDKSAVSILITAGGTLEDIDTVRSITNHATGRLGSLIADVFSQSGAKVVYVCGETSMLPETACEVVRIRGVAGLAQTIDRLMRENPYDCVIHSMAVSDYTPCAVMTADEITEAIWRGAGSDKLSREELSGRIWDIMSNGAGRSSDKKISSESEYLMMSLKRTPKVIGQIKKLRPDTLLIGFKLLSEACESELIKAGLDSIARNGCDYVLANDLRDISGDTHKAMLLDKGGIINRAGTKPEIAEMIFKTVMERMRQLQ